jgi:P-type Ca2+ transporter type 2C
MLMNMAFNVSNYTKLPLLHSVLTDSAALILVILAGTYAQSRFHIPAAITLWQILVINIFLHSLSVTNTAREAHKNHKTENYLKYLLKILVLGGLVAGLAYGNYLYFFIRTNLSPAYLDSTSALYAQASMITCLSIFFCQFINLLMMRADRHDNFFSPHLWSNKKLLRSFAAALIVILCMIYNPWDKSHLHVGHLDVIDWLTVLLAAATYMAIRLLQRHTRKHSRHAVLQLHHQVHGPKT